MAPLKDLTGQRFGALAALPAMPTLDYYHALDAVMAAYPTGALAKLAKDRYIAGE